MWFLNGEPFVLVDFMAYCLQSVMIAITLVVVAVPEGFANGCNAQPGI